MRVTCPQPGWPGLRGRRAPGRRWRGRARVSGAGAWWRYRPVHRETFDAGGWLFLAVEARDYDTRLGAQAARFRQGGRRLTHWIAAHPGEDGTPPAISAPHDARRLRKTAKTTRVAALGGTPTPPAAHPHP